MEVGQQGKKSRSGEVANSFGWVHLKSQLFCKLRGHGMKIN
jgi:hypothetical protein